MKLFHHFPAKLSEVKLLNCNIFLINLVSLGFCFFTLRTLSLRYKIIACLRLLRLDLSLNLTHFDKGTLLYTKVQLVYHLGICFDVS
jgi:hypothetical protein